ncbi:protein phosphatase 1H isoform X2 [Corvus cornix cornix]|uniref:protein phosphatase 1H isoform X2 n=1 Tax=Corvus cornix cornix TaxID=932674 RepID=UPI001951EB33|nr:protein phosphatase 1H isoform X2 [Corvus cornix cornix]
MLTRVKSAVANFMGGIMAGSAGADHGSGADLPLRFPYGRPEFLGLSPDEVECSADHIARPILILSKDTRRLPWTTGYAEVINAGKSTHNEDQASCEVLFVKKKAGGSNSTPNKNSSTKRRSSLPNGEGLQLKDNSDTDGINLYYWSLFDGHAGSGAAVVASKLLQHHILGQLQEIVDILRNTAVLPPTCLGEEPDNPSTNSRTLTRAASLRGGVGAPGSPSTPPTRFFTEKKIPHECLVIGAIESAFKEMDLQIERERTVYNISGGCTALVVVYLLGKLYVANAGDSRAIIIRNGEVIPMSSEFTPETERQRLQYLAYMQPHLLGNEFTHLEFPRRVQRKEVGKRMLYRDFNMTGWAYKTIEEDDLKFPLIYGEGKKARVMATIGVTRGLGDHDLKVHDSNIYIKPFLSSSPEVRVYDLLQYEHGPDDVLILATDGLWDVLLNEEVAEAVTNFLPNCDPDDPHRNCHRAGRSCFVHMPWLVFLLPASKTLGSMSWYTLAAQDLVMRARGVLKDRGWRISNDRLGSGDDISVYVIPLIHGNKQL